jgi:hypothetical protein
MESSAIAAKTEQGCESRKPPPSNGSPQRDHIAQDPLAHPSGSLRFYPIKSKGSRASGSPLSSQRVTHPQARRVKNGARHMTNGAIKTVESGPK